MHTATYNKTTFVYNGDYSGPINIEVDNVIIETDINALKQFVDGATNCSSQKTTQKIITESDKNIFTKKVNDHLTNGWKVVIGTLTISHPNTEDEFPFRYAIVLENNSKLE